MSNKLKSLIILALFLSTIVMSIQQNYKVKPTYIDSLLNFKRDFNKSYNNTDRLFDLYLNRKYKFSISNKSQYSQYLNADSFFYSQNKLIRKIDIKKTDTDEIKAIKILKTIQGEIASSLPLYNSFKHDPFYQLSVYGFGHCGAQSELFALISNLYGLKSRVWFLDKHSVAEVQYNNTWHMFDPDTLGYILVNNQVGSLEQVATLARQNKLKAYNESIAEFNKSNYYDLHLDEYTKEQLKKDKLMEFYPNESKIFFDELTSITTDGFYTNNYYPPQKILNRNSKTTANFVREIPIRSFGHTNKIQIKDEFPIVGVFIYSNKPITPDTIPKITLDSDKIRNNSQIIIKGDYYRPLKFLGKIIDLSIGVNNFESRPSYSIDLADTKLITEKYPDAKIITVHLYAKNNIDLGENNLRLINRDIYNFNTDN